MIQVQYDDTTSLILDEVDGVDGDMMTLILDALDSLDARDMMIMAVFDFNDKFRFEQFRTAQATTVPIPGDLEVE